VTEPRSNSIPDNHVHTEWSWDAPHGDMTATCRRAVQLGLPSIAFTEHADWARGDDCVVDLAPYLEAVERCRAEFPDLRILSGVELGEPHHHAEAAQALLSAAPLDRVLASVHYVRFGIEHEDASMPGFLREGNAGLIFRTYLADIVALLESDQSFEALAHLDYPKRYWPQALQYDEADFEDEFRAALRAAAKRGVAIEINTTRGGPVERALCPGPKVLRWWREEGGRAVSFGSDAHSPEHLAARFELAADVAEAAGFKSQADPNAFWLV
jgi:histidinol-phosphatase (PHP family)